MKLIQIYDTSEGENYNIGFTTFQDMITFWNNSLNVHSLLFDEIEIYTDIEGYEKIKNKLIPPSNCIITIIKFNKVDSRFWNTCKFIVHTLQDKPYIMCDIDLCMSEKPVFITDVICEFIRGARSNIYYNHFNVEHKYVWIPASGVIGFNDIEFAKKYANSALDKINIERLDYVKYETLWTLEEAYLAKLIDSNKKSLSVINVKYIHLRDNMK